MPSVGRIRLGKFCDMIGQDRETVRTAIRTFRFPVRRSKGEGQRTFDGRDALAYELFLAMTENGSSQDWASKVVILSLAPEQFLKALEEGQPARELCLVSETRGHRIFPLVMPTGEIGEYIAERIRPSTYRDEADVDLSMRRFVVVPLWPAWLLARDRAKAAGYRLAGSLLLPLSDNPEAEQ